MATLIIAGITITPLLLLVGDLALRTRRPDEKFAGPARTPTS
jgi:hypothetical protein